MPLAPYPPSTYRLPPTLQTAVYARSAGISAMASHWLADGLYLSTDLHCSPPPGSLQPKKSSSKLSPWALAMNQAVSYLLFPDKLDTKNLEIQVGPKTTPDPHKSQILGEIWQIGRWREAGGERAAREVGVGPQGARPDTNPPGCPPPLKVQLLAAQTSPKPTFMGHACMNKQD